LAYQQKNYDQASLAAQRILDIQKKVLGPNDSQLIDTYNQLIAALCVGGKCEDTEPLLKEQLEVRSKSLGPEHPHVAVSLCLLGESAEKKKDYERALKYYENALTIRRKTDPMLVRQTEKNVLRVHQKAMDQDR
ncbi:MAG: tetratricopeptide repeat protein, partial [Cyanobacteria bacterium]|nr:tetratricopeptide repeat protein [Cyanobacteriota bacterium]